MNLERYHSTMAAAKILADTMLVLNREDGPMVTSPAWRFVRHAKEYCLSQAELSFNQVSATGLPPIPAQSAGAVGDAAAPDPICLGCEAGSHEEPIVGECACPCHVGVR